MKKHLLIFIVFIFVCLYNSHSQQQWKFHLAFEDATGAKDTIWFIWDTTATFYGLDTALGEYPVTLDYNKFNVWTYNPANEEYDTLKTLALPYDYGIISEIVAINFELPVKISWDSALFHADWLPPQPVGWVNVATLYNDYFFWVNNTEEHYYDLTQNDHTISPDSTIVGTEDDDPFFWIPDVNFPLWISLAQDPTLLISDVKSTVKGYFIYPNPFSTTTTLQFNLNTTDAGAVEIKIFDQAGREIKQMAIENTQLGKNSIEISMEGFPAGMYYYSLFINGRQTATRKMVVAR